MPITNIVFKTVRICHPQFNSNYLKNKKNFLNFVFHFWCIHQILKIFKEKMTLIANVFLKLQTVKNFVRTLSIKRCFRTRFYSQHVKSSEILAISRWQRFYYAFSWFLLKLICKMSPLVLGEILGVFVNTLIVDDRYRVQDCENLPLPIQ